MTNIITIFSDYLSARLNAARTYYYYMIETQTEQHTYDSAECRKPRSVKDIRKPIEGDLKAFNSYFKKALRTDVFLLNQILSYMLVTKGKQMRPMLVFLSARVFGEVSERSYTAATMIELLHSATLIHDDVVDDADRRRGFLSINKLWKSKASVLLGDFLLSKGLLVALENEEFELLRVLSTAVKKMSEGELRQMKAAKLLNMTEDKYYRIISEKTASLLSACTECGTISATDDQHYRELMRDMGLNMGIAFQIRDDLFDYEEANSGKSEGNDIIERKITLPLIAALDRAGYFERKAIKRKFRNKKKSRKDVEEIINFVREKDGVSYARAKMRHFADTAASLLHELPEGKERDDLEDFIHFVINRKK